MPAKREIAARYDLDPDKPLALLVFHPVLQEAAFAGEQIDTILAALRSTSCQTVALLPNADAGSAIVRERLLACAGTPGFSVQTHLARDHFIAVMAAADLMIGNSSAGIIEAASFGTPVLNLGRRQNLRERNANVADVPMIDQMLVKHIASALEKGRYPNTNCYGDGQSANRITELLTRHDLTPDLLMKVNSY
jgi:GDP/UDP-N,N'-diacetylbacillosamine 2-epimerase (hydrolysing)